MSFGYSVGDFLLLTQLAYRTVQNAQKACGAHDDLAREVSSLHIVLQRVEVEVSKPDSILNKTEDNRRKELEKLGRHCERVLKVLEQILNKYNALPDEKRSVMKLWQKIRFGNGEMLDLGKIRSELATHTQALNMFLNLLSIGSQGKVEKYMDTHGEELRKIKHSLHWVTASMQASSHEEKSILTTYGEDDKAIWKAFRRELIEEGISSHLLDKHKRTIKKYVIELGERGAMDEPQPSPPAEMIDHPIITASHKTHEEPPPAPEPKSEEPTTSLDEAAPTVDASPTPKSAHPVNFDTGTSPPAPDLPKSETSNKKSVRKEPLSFRFGSSIHRAAVDDFSGISKPILRASDVHPQSGLGTTKNHQANTSALKYAKEPSSTRLIRGGKSETQNVVNMDKTVETSKNDSIDGLDELRIAFLRASSPVTSSMATSKLDIASSHKEEVPQRQPIDITGEGVPGLIQVQPSRERPAALVIIGQPSSDETRGAPVENPPVESAPETKEMTPDLASSVVAEAIIAETPSCSSSGLGTMVGKAIIDEPEQLPEVAEESDSLGMPMPVFVTPEQWRRHRSSRHSKRDTHHSSTGNDKGKRYGLSADLVDNKDFLSGSFGSYLSPNVPIVKDDQRLLSPENLSRPGRSSQEELWNQTEQNGRDSDDGVVTLTEFKWQKAKARKKTPKTSEKQKGAMRKSYPGTKTRNDMVQQEIRGGERTNIEGVKAVSLEDGRRISSSKGRPRPGVDVEKRPSLFSLEGVLYYG